MRMAYKDKSGCIGFFCADSSFVRSSDDLFIPYKIGCSVLP